MGSGGSLLYQGQIAVALPCLVGDGEKVVVAEAHLVVVVVHLKAGLRQNQHIAGPVVISVDIGRARPGQQGLPIPAEEQDRPGGTPQRNRPVLRPVPGVPPQTQLRLAPIQSRQVNALMMTSGMYQNAGEFAWRVGLPAKSGVGGGIVAIVPHEMAIAVWSPELDPAGNSLAGIAVLEQLTQQLGRSVY